MSGNLVMMLSREAAVLVTTVNIHKGDTGSIIVGGRLEDLREPEESLHRYIHNILTSTYKYLNTTYVHVRICSLYCIYVCTL